MWFCRACDPCGSQKWLQREFWAGLDREAADAPEEPATPTAAATPAEPPLAPVRGTSALENASQLSEPESISPAGAKRGKRGAAAAAGAAPAAVAAGGPPPTAVLLEGAIVFAEPPTGLKFPNAAFRNRCENKGWKPPPGARGVIVYRWSEEDLSKQRAPAALKAAGALAAWQHGERCCIVAQAGLRADPAPGEDGCLPLTRRCPRFVCVVDPSSHDVIMAQVAQRHAQPSSRYAAVFKEAVDYVQARGAASLRFNSLDVYVRGQQTITFRARRTADIS